MLSEDKLMASVESIMRSPAVTAQFSDTVSSVVERMVSYDIGSVIIISGGAPVGIVTERDIVNKIVRMNKDANKTLARDVMSSPLITIEANKSLADALRVLRDRKIRRLAVTRGGALVGIITERRILEHLAST